MTTQALDRAASYATCRMLEAGGAALIGSAVWSARAGAVALIPLSLGALSFMAQNALCGPIDLGEIPDPISDQIEGCGEIEEGGSGIYQIKYPEGNWLSQTDKPIYTRAVKIIPQEPFLSTTGGTWSVNCEVYGENDATTDTVSGLADEAAARAVKFRILPSDGSTCKGYGGGDIPAPPPIPDITYSDSETNCTFNLRFDGFYSETPSSTPGTVWTITEATEGKSSSTIVGGCAVNNIRIYKPPSGGPIIPIEPPSGDGGDGGDGGGDGGNGGGGDGGGGDGGGGGGGGNDPNNPPLWLGPLIDIISGALGLLLADLINALGEYREEANWTLNYPCEVDEEGNPKVKTYTTEGYGFVKEMMVRTNLLAEMVNDQFNGKTPICGPDAPSKPEGEFRTINFRSASASPYSNSRLRKRFRYRSTSGLGLGDVVDHWKDFFFESGPVVVGHVGSSWGTPQVWAATEDEGKRVIRHAAGEAGIDPDQVGRWRIGSSNSARLGVSDTMSVDTEGGFYRITSRDGSDGRPIVAKDLDL